MVLSKARHNARGRARAARGRDRAAYSRGFTLVELLVVIAIISLLMSILLPSLRKARQQALRVTCLANLRTQSTAMAAYSSEFDGQMPPCYIGDRPGMWYRHNNGDDVWEYLSSQSGYEAYLCPEFWNDEENNARGGGGYGSTYMAAVDPKWRNHFEGMPQVQFLGHRNAGSCGWFQYRRNPWGRVDAAVTSGYTRSPRNGAHYMVSSSHRVEDVEEAGRVSARAECYPAYGGWYNWDNGRTFDALGGNMRHLGSDGHPEGGNVMYVDGHCDWSELFGPQTNQGDIGFPWLGSVFVVPSAPDSALDAARAGPLW